MKDALEFEAHRVATAFEVVKFGVVGSPSNFIGKRVDGVPVMWHIGEGGEWDSITVGGGTAQCVVFRPSGSSDWVYAPHPKFNGIMEIGLQELGFEEEKALKKLR